MWNHVILGVNTVLIIAVGIYYSSLLITSIGWFAAGLLVADIAYDSMTKEISDALGRTLNKPKG